MGTFGGETGGRRGFKTSQVKRLHSFTLLSSLTKL
jgi:hypothetical protein